MNNTIQDFINTIDKLTVEELGKLKTSLSELWGVPLQSTIAPGIAQDSAKPEETASYSISLENCGANKMSVLKLVREVLNLPLKEAKDFVDSVPKIIKDEVEQTEADVLKKKFEDLGATIKMTVL